MTVTTAHSVPDAVYSNEYLTFCLGSEQYGLNIDNVQEIRSYQQPTRVPDAPPSMKGVINLRGVIVPIIDLRVKLDHPDDINAFTVVIVLNVKGRIVGIVVDSVSDVLVLSPAEIEPVDQYPSDKGRFVVSTAVVGERVLLFMDIAGLLESP